MAPFEIRTARALQFYAWASQLLVDARATSIQSLPNRCGSAQPVCPYVPTWASSPHTVHITRRWTRSFVRRAETSVLLTAYKAGTWRRAMLDPGALFGRLQLLSVSGARRAGAQRIDAHTSS